MLVKLGGVWIDPAKVESIEITGKDIIKSIKAVTNTEPYTCWRDDGIETAETKLDEFASIVNDALQTSSFGGEIDEPEKAAS